MATKKTLKSELSKALDEVERLTTLVEAEEPEETQEEKITRLEGELEAANNAAEKAKAAKALYKPKDRTAQERAAIVAKAKSLDL